MRSRQFLRAAGLIVATALIAAPAFADTVTGNPSTDGWTSNGNSLEKGVYTSGEANYGFDTYGSASTITASSVLATQTNWLVGDTVLGVGGIFTNAAPSQWTVTGGAINQYLPAASGPKLQAKFGGDTSTFAAANTAPGGVSNGSDHLGGNGGTGAVQVRTSGYLSPANWLSGAGTLTAPTSGHFEQNQDPSHTDVTVDADLNAARLIWNTDANGQVTSWEILLNTSLLGRIDGGIATPSVGNLAIMTVQNGDNAFTDALVTTASPQAVPLPASAPMGLLLIGGLAFASNRRRKAI